MSFNRLPYDNCAYKHALHENVGTLAYVLDPSKFENCNKCRMELGIVGGTNVSHIKGNLVDLETDLRGTTRVASKCPTKKYINPCPNGDMTSCQPNQIVVKGHPANTLNDRTLDTNMEHLSSCQMIRYRNTPLEPQIPKVLCPSNNNSNMSNYDGSNITNNLENFTNQISPSNVNQLYAKV